MAWNGSGVFSRTNGSNSGSTTWQQDEAGAVDIEADRHDTHDEDLAAGIQACLAKNGENAMTGDLSLGGNDITNLGSIIGNAILTGTLNITDTTAVDLANAVAAFLVGAGTGQHLEMDGNDIQSKSDATTAAQLNVNQFGGDVLLGAQSGTGGAELWKDGTKRIESTTTGGQVDGTFFDLDAGADANTYYRVWNSQGGIGLRADVTTGDARLSRLDGTGGVTGTFATFNQTTTAVGLGNTNVTGTLEASTDVTVGGVSVALSTDVGLRSDEEIQDVAGAMFTGNTETGITATYEDGDGTIDLVLDASSLTAMSTALVGSDQFVVNDGGTTKKLAVNDIAIPVATDAGTHTFAAADLGEARVYTGSTSSDAWTMNTGIGIAGQAILVVNDGGSDGPTITAGTATVESSSGNFVVKQEGMAILFQAATNVWKLSGDLV